MLLVCCSTALWALQFSAAGLLTLMLLLLLLLLVLLLFALLLLALDSM
jgi:hypothetical protein